VSLDVYLVVRSAVDDQHGYLYSANITHNLGKMAAEAGIYEAMWRPEELTPPAVLAKDITSTLRNGLAMLINDPPRFKALNPSNGWGDYYGFVTFVRNYLAACERYPAAEIRVSR